MQMPSGWGDAPAKTGGGGFVNPEEGPYIMKIRRAVACVSKSGGNNQLAIELDIAKGEFAGFYSELSNKLNKDVYPKFYQLTDGDHLPYFKGLIECVESSNAGFKFNFDENTLSGKLIGAMMVDETYTNKDGVEKTILKPRWLFDISTIDSQRVPSKKNASPAASASTTVSDFRNGDDPRNEADLPF